MKYRTNKIIWSCFKVIANRSHRLILDIRILFANLPSLPEEFMKTLFYLPKITPWWRSFRMSIVISLHVATCSEVECNKIFKHNGILYCVQWAFPIPLSPLSMLAQCHAWCQLATTLVFIPCFMLSLSFPSPRLGGVCIDLMLPVGTHKYMFIVDGERKLDPSNTLVSHCCFIDSCMCLEFQQENLLPGT